MKMLLSIVKMPRFSSDWMAVIVICLGNAAVSEHAIAQRSLGIDVSSYQGSINWTNVKSSGVSFAWAKATEGTFYIDAYFTANEANAKSAGVLIGAYHFAHPEEDTGTAGADTEAAYFWNEARNYLVSGAYLMPMLDLEETYGTEAEMSAWVNEWCQDIKNYAAASGAVVYPVVYTEGSIANDYLNSSVTQWPLYIADPNGANPETGSPTVGLSPWPTWAFWQYSWTGSVPGISGDCDEDVFDGDAASLQAYLITNLSSSAGAGVSMYWDPGTNNASPGSGGTGVWNTGTGDWWLGGTGDVAWSTGGDYAVFDGTSGAVTLGDNVSADGLTFNKPGYIIYGDATLTLNNPGNIIVPPGSPTSINCVLGGVGYILSGGGELVLNNAENWCGNGASPEYVIGPGTTLAVATDHDAGNDGVTLNLQNGAIYQDNDTTSGDEFLLSGSAVSLLSGGGIFENPNANLTMSNFITGSGSLTIIGTTHILTLTDAGNNYSGGTIIQSGTLKANAAGTMGSISGPLTVSGGALDLGGASHTVGTTTISGGTIQNGKLTGSSYTGQSGTVTAVLAGAGAMTKTTSGTLILNGANIYSGNTTISVGTLALGSTGSINSSPGISLAAGATFDVSAISSYALSGSTSLSASGTSAAATIIGGATVSLGSSPIVLTYDGSHPALTISQGILSLNGNAFTVNGSPLPGGNTYTIIQQASGTITSSGSYSVNGTVTGLAGTTAAISVSGGNVVLTVTDTTTTSLNTLTPSIYGQSVTFTATVAPSPAGGTVQFYDNGMALGGPVTISGGSATYSTSTLSVGNHPITASYSGITGYAASSTASSSTQQVTLPPNTIPVTISGTTIVSNGAVQMNFIGTPGYTYWIEGATCLNPPITWTTLSTNVADINGLFNFIDLDATNYNSRYYRTAIP
jgi:autotransporter-associated beta strand protein